MYRIPQLKKVKGIYHAFSTKDEGNMANSILGQVYDFDAVIGNRRRFFKKAGIPIEKTVAIWVLGGDGIETAKEKDMGVSMIDYKEAVKTDGLITNKSGVYLMLLTADCLPIIVFDTKQKVVGVVHAGWSGVHLNITKKAIEKLKKVYNSETKNLIVAFGPAAQKESFVKNNPSQKNNKKWKGYIKRVAHGKYSVNFVGLCKKQFIDGGVPEENILDCGLDTVKDDRFFSHYREKNEPLKNQGRFACVVGLA